MTDPRVAIPERNAAGEAVNYGGDPRRGVGLRVDGLPDIEWMFVPERDPKSGRREYTYGYDNPTERRTEADFWIARYPVTYRQFQEFLDAPDGFRDARWREGLDVPPMYWTEAGEQRFRHWNHPRDSVNWFDSIAFCRWLTEKANEHHGLLPAKLDRSREWQITLPTEQQWEKAARGHDGRLYPWGSVYEGGRANVNEGLGRRGTHNLEKTTAVGMYPHNAPDDSPYGVADLSGNVLEWCLNDFVNPEYVQLAGSDWRVLRGGSWQNSADYAAAPGREANHPAYRLDSYGFRVCAAIRQQ